MNFARPLSTAAVVVLLLAGQNLAQAQARAPKFRDGIGTAKFGLDKKVTNFSANANTIPYFRSSYVDPTNGVRYPYTMVGTNPATSNATTTVPTVIIPFNLVFENSPIANNSLDGSTKVNLTKQSPVFKSANIGLAASTTASAPPDQPGVAPDPRLVNEPDDTTQVGDAIYRAQWGKTGSGYHVKLGYPTVLSTVTIVVPKNLGFMIVGSVSGRRIGLMDSHWFSNQLNNTLRNYHISSKTLPIFLLYNTFLYDKTPDICCTLGFHGATTSLNGNGQQQVNTYMFASYSDSGLFGPNPGDNGASFISDIHGLSHEVQEWLDDPFVNNRVNPWLTPTAPQYGCTAFLETGDPVVGFGFKVTMPNGVTYHPEDEVHFSWFARQKPSIAEQGYYTYLNNFADRAHGCD